MPFFSRKKRTPPPAPDLAAQLLLDSDEENPLSPLIVNLLNSERQKEILEHILCLFNHAMNEMLASDLPSLPHCKESLHKLFSPLIPPDSESDELDEFDALYTILFTAPITQLQTAIATDLKRLPDSNLLDAKEEEEIKAEHVADNADSPLSTFKKRTLYTLCVITTVQDCLREVCTKNGLSLLVDWDQLNVQYSIKNLFKFIRQAETNLFPPKHLNWVATQFSASKRNSLYENQHSFESHANEEPHTSPAQPSHLYEPTWKTNYSERLAILTLYSPFLTSLVSLAPLIATYQILKLQPQFTKEALPALATCELLPIAAGILLSRDKILRPNKPAGRLIRGYQVTTDALISSLYVLSVAIAAELSIHPDNTHVSYKYFAQRLLPAPVVLGLLHATWQLIPKWRKQLQNKHPKLKRSLDIAFYAFTTSGALTLFLKNIVPKLSETPLWQSVLFVPALGLAYARTTPSSTKRNRIELLIHSLAAANFSWSMTRYANQHAQDIVPTIQYLRIAAWSGALLHGIAFPLYYGKAFLKEKDLVPFWEQHQARKEINGKDRPEEKQINPAFLTQYRGATEKTSRTVRTGEQNKRPSLCSKCVIL